MSIKTELEQKEKKQWLKVDVLSLREGLEHGGSETIQGLRMPSGKSVRTEQAQCKHSRQALWQQERFSPRPLFCC